MEHLLEANQESCLTAWLQVLLNITVQSNQRHNYTLSNQKVGIFKGDFSSLWLI